MKLPAIRTIGLQQNVCQLFLSDWTLDQPAKAEAKRSLMIGRDLNLDLDCLFFSICLGNKRWIISVFTRVDVLGIFNVVRITTNSHLPLFFCHCTLKPPQFNSLSVNCFGRWGNSLQAEFLLGGSSI